MSLQDWALWAGILGGGGGLLGGVYAAADSFRKRKKMSVDQAGMVANTAIQLVDQLEKRAEHLERQLDAANKRAGALEDKLLSAKAYAEDLQHAHDAMAEQLTNAQAEVRVLRVQVKHLTAELDRRGGCPDGPAGATG